MARNFFREMKGREGVFRDETLFLPQFIPDELPGRERQMKEMAFNLSVASEGKAPMPMILAGPPGTGKTSSSKLLLKQLEEVSGKPFQIYINCWECTTRLGVLSELVVRLGGMLPRRGIAADEVASKLKELGKKTSRLPIIILDEVDRLVAANEEGVLYDLARAYEVFSLRASVIAITNDSELPAKLDARIRSSFAGRVIEFPPYGPKELKSILNERAKLAFFPDSLDEEVVPLCAAVAAKLGGDARIAIHLLWAAAKRAEREGRMEVTVADVKAEKERAVNASRVPAARKIGSLDEFGKKLIGIITESGKAGVESREIYEKLGAGPSLQRNIRIRLAKLEKSGLVESKETKKGSGHAKKYFIKKLG